MVEKTSTQRARDDELRRKMDEKRTTQISRKRKLQEIYAVCRHIERSKPFPNADIIATWGALEDVGSNMEDAERRFLEENDLEKGRLFDESTLPSYSHHHSSYLPEPGGSKKSPAQTSNSTVNQGSATTTSPSSSKATPSPAVAEIPQKTPEIISNEASQDENIRSSIQTNNQNQAPLPSSKEVISRPSSPSHLSNGHSLTKDDPMPAQAVKSEVESNPTSFSSIKPLDQAVEPQHSPTEARSESSAKIVDIGGVPVIQETTTHIPDEAEKSAGVHPPPIPTELLADNDSDDEMTDSTPHKLSSQALSEPGTANEKIIEIGKEIPDSQGSSQKSPSEISLLPPPRSAMGEAKLSASPIHPPLVVVTHQRQNVPNIPSSNPVQEVDISSPASSIDIEEGTPNNAILSSATSPDPAHPYALERERTKESITEEEVGDEERRNILVKENGVNDEGKGEVMVKKPDDSMEEISSSKELTLVEAEDVLEAKTELEVRLPVIPPDELRKSSEIGRLEEGEPESLREESETPAITAHIPEKKEGITLPHPGSVPQGSNITHNSVVGKVEILETPATKLAPIEPTSPDPSAQLRLEYELAKKSLTEGIAPGRESDGKPTIKETPGINPKETTAEVVGDGPREESVDQVRLVGNGLPEPVPQLVDDEETKAVGGQEKEAKAAKPAIEMTKGAVAKEIEENGVEEGGAMDMDHTLLQTEKPETSPNFSQDDVVMAEVDSGQMIAEASISVSSPKPEAVESAKIEGAVLTAEDTRVEAINRMGPNTDRDEEESAEKSFSAAETKSRTETPIENSDVNTTAPGTRTTTEVPTPSLSSVIKSALPIVNAPASTVATPSRASLKAKERERTRSSLRKVVISSAHHAAAAAEAEARRLREDQENQGMIVVARRRDQQAASAAARGRSAVFQPGSKIDVMTRYGIADPPPTEEEQLKGVDLFDVLYTVKSSPVTSSELISRSSKTLSTSNHQIHLFESRSVRTLERIKELQDRGLWSLRQIPRVREPRRRKCHWDYLLDEAKWLREDFKEERRWKIAVARSAAVWCAEWYNTGPERRKELEVDRKKWGRLPKYEGIRQERRNKRVDCGGDVEMSGYSGEISQPTPELMPSGGTPEESSEDEGMFKFGGGDFSGHLRDPPPAAIFTLSPEETIFAMPPTKAAQDTLDQLPLFAPPKPPTTDHGRFEEAEEEWLMPIVPVTKYATGKIVLKNEEEQGPPRKKSRYEYDENYELFADDSDEEDGVNGGHETISGYGRRPRDKTRKPVPLPPEQTNVGLFRPEFKSIQQRIHNSHVLRPPADMPPSAFFECRSPSLWTIAEDEMLRQLAKEYNHNWALISTCMELDGTWHSGGERRSPWECFERWLSLESVPPEFMKSPYYKHVQHRLDIAQRVGTYYSAAVPGGGPGGAPRDGGAVVKKRGTIPMRVEKRRITKYVSVVEAMRRLAKKRETSVNQQQKNSRAVQLAAMRKAQEQPNSASQMRTPQYFSMMKHEKELKQMEQKALYQQHIQNLQRNGGQAQPARVAAPIPPQHRMGTPGTPNLPSSMSNGVPQNSRPGSSGVQALASGVPMHGGSGVPINGVPVSAGQRTAQMQQGVHRQYTPEQMQQLQQIQRMRVHQAQQAQAQQAQQQQQNGQSQQGYSQSQQAPVPLATSPVAGIQQPFQHPQNNVQAMLHQAQQAALGGQKSVTNSGAQPFSQQGQKSKANITELITQQQNPGLTSDQVAKNVPAQVATFHSQNRTAPTPGGGAATSQHILQQVMRVQQQQQQVQNRVATANTGPMIGANGPVGTGAASSTASRSVTPQQRPGSAQSPRQVPAQLGQGQQASPRIGVAQVNGGGQ